MASRLPDTSKSGWIFEELESEFRVLLFHFQKSLLVSNERRFYFMMILRIIYMIKCWKISTHKIFYCVLKWLVEHRKEIYIKPFSIKSEHTEGSFGGWLYFFLLLFSMILLLYGIIQNIYTMLSNELNAAIFINIGLFTCLFCSIVDIILNLNGKYGSNQCTCGNITTKSNNVCSNFGIM